MSRPSKVTKYLSLPIDAETGCRECGRDAIAGVVEPLCEKHYMEKTLTEEQIDFVKDNHDKYYHDHAVSGRIISGDSDYTPQGNPHDASIEERHFDYNAPLPTYKPNDGSDHWVFAEVEENKWRKNRQEGGEIREDNTTEED